MKTNLEDKMSVYEQLYFGEDEPVPFVGELKIYPAVLKDYYKFYSLINCFTIDKNADKTGIADRRDIRDSSKFSHSSYLVTLRILFMCIIS